MKDLLSIKRPVTDCGKPVVKLEAYSGCDVDSFTGHFYGEGDVQTKSPGFGGTIEFKKISNIHAHISRVPRKITRTISYFCRTQKVRSSKIWQVEAMDIYPVWKMNEIEEMMEAETLSVDGEEVVYRGDDAAFRLALDTCKDMFLMRFNVEECAKQQIFGCKSDCKTNNDKYINITDGIFGGDMSTSKFFNSSKSLVASSYDGFKEWLRVQNGVTNVEEVDNSTMKCSSYKVLKVSGNGNIDNIYYATKTNQNNKIYLRPVNDINELCNNQDNTQCTPLVLGIPTLIEEECEPIVFGTPIIELIGGDCDIALMNNWTQGSGDTSFTGGIGSNSINLSLVNTNYKGNGGGTGVPLDYNYMNTTGVAVCEFHLGQSGIGAAITEVKINGSIIDPSGYTYDDAEAKLILIDCLPNEGQIEVDYVTAVTTSNYMLYGETVAKITGNCLPNVPVYITTSCNSSVPDGTTIVIDIDGSMKWWGQVTFSDNNGSKIDVTNLVYTT